jgi:hypothetical protein
MYVVLSTVDPARSAEPAYVSGTVRITLPAFARQLTTLRGRPRDILRFVARFTARLILPVGADVRRRTERDVRTHNDKARRTDAGGT